jgi:hypothetical protein
MFEEIALNVWGYVKYPGLAVRETTTSFESFVN